LPNFLFGGSINRKKKLIFINFHPYLFCEYLNNEYLREIFQTNKYKKMTQKTENSSVLTTSNLIITELTDLINDPNFVDKHKKNSKDFIRNRVLTFKITILFLINVLKEGIQSELGTFFSQIEPSDTKINKATNSALTQARAKLNHSAFIEMDKLQTKLFYENAEYKTWNGYRLIAVDGSTLYLPSSKETQKEFGISETKKNGQKIVLARISEAFDALNHITIDACISAYQVCEHDMMLQHLKHLKKGDLAIYDRNYPGFWIYKIHQHLWIEYCMRIQLIGRGKFIEDFLASGALEAIVDVSCSYKSKLKCKELGLDTEPIKCRLIRIELSSGETEVLVTSLLDMVAFPYEYFKALYHLRWPVEENYKFLKQRIELGNFTGLTAESISQDFYAKIFMSNLTSILSFDADAEIKVKKAHCKLGYKINLNNAVQNMKKSAILLFIREQFMVILNELHILFQVNPVSIRPDRTFERNEFKPKRHYSMCYK